MNVSYFGKPHAATFEYAEKVIRALPGGAAVERIYMIGDNPETDIKGALAAGGPWRAALVHTGMAVPGDDDGGAHLVEADALAAVRAALASEQDA